MSKLAAVVTLLVCACLAAGGVLLFINLEPSTADRALPQIPAALAVSQNPQRVDGGTLPGNVSGLSSDPLRLDGLSEEVEGPVQQDRISLARSGLDEVPICTPQMRLVGAVVVSGSEERSFAYVETRGGTMLSRVGTSVDGLKVIGIRERQVFFRSSTGAICQVTMLSASRDKAIASRPAEDGASQDEMEKGITPHGDGMTFTIRRSLLQKALADFSSLTRSARAVPYEEDGQVVGVMLLDVRDSSLFARLGLRSGDIIRAVEGLHFSDPELAFSRPESILPELQMLGEMDNANVLVLRDGDWVTMDYYIQ